jgi:hypothetical protein
MRAGYLVVFAWPLVALVAFSRGGAWAWVFVPVLLGLGAAELAGLWWSRARHAAPGRPARPSPPRTSP